MHSVTQADRGELVSQEEVEEFFSDWEKEATSR
jgi:predicted transcriptional regulator